MSNYEKTVLADGRAVLFRGDSLELMAAGLLKCDAIVSDPPYGIGFQCGGKAKNGRFAGFAGTKKSHGDDAPFDPTPLLEIVNAVEIDELKRDTKPIVLWGADYYKSKLPDVGQMFCKPTAINSSISSSRGVTSRGGRGGVMHRT